MKSAHRIVLMSIFSLSVARAQAGEVRATVVETKAPAFVPAAQGRFRLAGYLPKDAEVEVLGRTKDGRYLKVSASRANGAKTELFIRTKDVRARRLADSVAPAAPMQMMAVSSASAPLVSAPVSAPGAPMVVPATDVWVEETFGPDPYEPKHPWSFGAGLGGYSARGKTNFSISGDLRYLWRTYTETLFGVDLSFGTTSAVGMRIDQRLYGTWSESFRPYIQGGYRIADLSESKSSALDAGLGFQVWHHGGSYFELGAFYLWNTLFDEHGENGVVFGGSSGIRF